MDISEVFEQIGSGSTGFLGLLGSIFSSIGSLFGTTTEGTWTPNILGVCTFIALGAGLVWIAFAMIRKLLRASTKGI